VIGDAIDLVVQWVLNLWFFRGRGDRSADRQ
jgi:hypothetical protein